MHEPRGENAVDTVEFRVTAALAVGLSDGDDGETSIPSSETVTVVWREGPGDAVLIVTDRLGFSGLPNDVDGSTSSSCEYTEGRDANEAFRPLSGTESVPERMGEVSSTSFSGLSVTRSCSITGMGGRGAFERFPQWRR